MRQSNLSALLSGGALFLSASYITAEESSSNPLSVITEIQKLEAKSDAKCHATASRLEDFMYGTHLASETRFSKNDLLKSWIRTTWAKADQLAKVENSKVITAAHIKAAISLLKFPEIKENDGDWKVGFNSGIVDITSRDKRQYSSISYALRAILALQQEQLFSSQEKLTQLTPEAIGTIQLYSNLYVLASLQNADHNTRAKQQDEMDADTFTKAWIAGGLPANSSAEPIKGEQEQFILPSIVQQKLASYTKYNGVNNQVFVRNLQVYFAKRRWPADVEEGKKLKEYFATSVIHYCSDLYLMAQAAAKQRGESLIREEDVHKAVQGFTPFELDSFEDVTFFPKLDDAVYIEAYDLDAFRDSGIHWVYVNHAISESKDKLTLDTDPFAAELLAESVAQFGVLVLREAGKAATADGKEHLTSEYIDKGLRNIQDLIARSAKAPERSETQQKLASSPETKVIKSERYFDDVTEKTGINWEHRSSDWLSRMIRSYIDKGNGTGTITIPPAFGGAGIAAEDINNDGWADLLVLSGAGNKLYINQKDGTFSDQTMASGIDWKRPDGTYGEPRQPIIVDFDNDGWQDILITYVDDNHRVFRNKGDGTFEDMTGTAKLGGEGLVGGPATVLDYDKDGKLDIYIGYFGNYIKGTLPTLARRNKNALPNKLFRNVGGFKFEDFSSTAKIEDVGWTQAVGHSDFDGDGWQDIISGNDFGVNRYYRNKGDGTFEEVSELMGTDKPSYTMGIGIADLNKDKLPDYYISNIVTMNKDQKYVLPNDEMTAEFNPAKLANMRVVEANDLFLSSTTDNPVCKTSYTLSKMVDRGYANTGWAWDADFLDFDHDGDDDLYVLNGMNDFNIYSEENPFYAEPLKNQAMDVKFPSGRSEKNVFFTNKEGRLAEMTDVSGLGLVGNGRSAAYFDYDNDGDLDMAVNNYHGKIHIFENRVGSQSGNWLKVRLVGKDGKDAIGAIITATLDNGDTLWREVHSTTGYLSVHPKEQHFGLGNSKKVSLEIKWSDGTTTKETVPANKKLTISQP